MKSGRTFLEFGPSFEYMQIRSYQAQRHEWDTFPVVSAVYDNSDYEISPQRGNVTTLSLLRDFGTFGSPNPWTNVTAEYAQYISLGRSGLFRQQVLALDGWTSYTTSWSQSGTPGHLKLYDAPPFYGGSTLGGMQRPSISRGAIPRSCRRLRLRGTPPHSLLESPWQDRHLKGSGHRLDSICDLPRTGRVADEYNIDKLFHHMKGDGGIGVRILTGDTLFAHRRRGVERGRPVLGESGAGVLAASGVSQVTAPVEATNMSLQGGAPPGNETGSRGTKRGRSGWSNYFSLGSVSRAYRTVDNHVGHRLRMWLNAKHKVHCVGRSDSPTWQPSSGSASSAFKGGKGASRGRRHEVLLREPDAGNPPVRFDERDVETEPPRHRATSRLYPVFASSSCDPVFAFFSWLSRFYWHSLLGRLRSCDILSPSQVEDKNESCYPNDFGPERTRRTRRDDPACGGSGFQQSRPWNLGAARG